MHHRDNQGKHGHLFVIGGGEDRKKSKDILQRFVDVVGSGQPIVVLTAASEVGVDMWAIYDKAFGDLGARDLRAMHINERAAADRPDNVAAIDAAGGIFMVGGDQKRLLAMVDGTAVHAALIRAYQERGACIAGTSAGASAMCADMIAQGTADAEPRKDAVRLADGLRLLPGVVIDQHFSQRHRLPRLLTAVAQNTTLFGIGVDEDTALLIEAGVGAEVCGSGTVTVVDGRNAATDMAEIQGGDYPGLNDFRLHLLPAGSRYRFSESRRAVTCDRNTHRREIASASLLAFLVTVVGETVT
jgi:cyanophycinase